MDKAIKLVIRNAKIEDIPNIIKVEVSAWGQDLAATKEMFESRIKTFPDGVFVSIENDRITGVVVTQRVNYDIKSFSLNWYKATDDGFIVKSHKVNGKIIYGVNLSVTPNALYNTGTLLLETIGKLGIKMNLQYGMLGGRIPDYYKYHHIPVDEYIRKTMIINGRKKLLDKELNFYKRSGLRIVKAIPNYMNDPDSLNYGVLLVWTNPFYFITKYFPFLSKLFVNLFKII